MLFRKVESVKSGVARNIRGLKEYDLVFKITTYWFLFIPIYSYKKII